MSDKDTKINIKHYIGRAVDNTAVTVTSLIGLPVLVGLGVGFGLDSQINKEMDNVGTEQQQVAYAELSNNIHALDLKQAQIELSAKQLEINQMDGSLTGDALTQAQDDLQDLKRAFSINSQSTLLDIYMSGENGQEADISEQQAWELTQAFSEKVMPLSDLGLDHINPGTLAYLDEARQDIESTGNFIGDADALNQSMFEKSQNEEAVSVLGGVFSGIGLFMFLLFGEVIFRMGDWRYEDKRVPRRRKPKNSMNH